jgi:hypothetical protein
MGEMVSGLCRSVVSALRSKRDLVLENAALRHQLMVVGGEYQIRAARRARGGCQRVVREV